MSQLSNVVEWKKESDDIESKLIEREKEEDIINYVDILKNTM